MENGPTRNNGFKHVFKLHKAHVNECVDIRIEFLMPGETNWRAAPTWLQFYWLSCVYKRACQSSVGLSLALVPTLTF